MVHCVKHGLEGCPLCKQPEKHVERQLAIQRRVEEKAMRAYRTRDPYKHFGED